MQSPTKTREGLTRALVEFVSRTGFDDLPASVIEKVKIYALDCIAAGFVGSVQPWSRMVKALVEDAGGVEEASIFADERRVPVGQAALVNGCMIGAFESEHMGHNAHASGTVFPAALAIAEREHKSGRDFIAAMALGYETVSRIGDAQTNRTETERGFHNPSANGPFGAAVAAGKLLGFPIETMSNAFGIAGSHCAGIIEYAWNGAMTKRLHLGRAAQGGLESALLAQKGFTGPSTILEGRYGYFNAFSPAPELDLLLDGLGQSWQMESHTIKAYPCHSTCQSIVGAIQQLRRQETLDPETVTGIHIRGGHRIVEERFFNSSPDNMLGAQYSIAYSAAIAVYRDIDDPLNYDESVLTDPGIRRLAAVVTSEPGAAGAFAELEAEVEMTIDGKKRVLPARSFRGSPNDPLTFDEMEAKFRRFTRSMIEMPHQTAIVEAVRGLADLDDLSRLAALIRQ